MQSKYKEHGGGGGATGLGTDLISFLSQGLNTGTFGTGNAMGTDVYGTTTGVAGTLNDILSGGAGTIGGSMQDMITRSNQRQVLDTRSRFGAQGGSAFGTGAQFAEGVQKAELAPQLTAAIGQLQLQTLMPILQMMMGLGGKGITQRQGVMQPSGWASGLNILANGLSQVLPMFKPGGSAQPASIGGMTPPASVAYEGIANPRINSSPSQIPWVMPSIANYGMN